MTEQTDPLRLLTLEEAAKRLGVRWANVRELVETGQLRAVKIGSRYRVPASALRDLGVSFGVSSTGSIEEPARRNGTTIRPLRAIKTRGWDGAG